MVCLWFGCKSEDGLTWAHVQLRIIESLRLAVMQERKKNRKYHFICVICAILSGVINLSQKKKETNCSKVFHEICQIFEA